MIQPINSFCVDCRDTSIKEVLDAPATEKGIKSPSQGLQIFTNEVWFQYGTDQGPGDTG